MPLQSWPLAYWPDGSLKWSAHAIPGAAPAAGSYTLTGGEPAAPEPPVTVREHRGFVEVDTGVINARIPTSGPHLISRVRRGTTVIARDGHLVNLVQHELPDDAEGRERASDELLRTVMARASIREYAEVLPQLADIYREVA